MTRKGTTAEQLATWAASVTYDDLPDEVIAIAKRLVLDQIGLQVRGSTLTHVAPVREQVEQMEARPEAPITGHPSRTTAAQAAYVNATFGASMEFDDSHLLAWHASSVLVSASVAFAEKERRGGRDVLLALAVGHQIMATLGSITTQGMLARGWHGPKAIGGFAAAAAAAKLLDVDAETLADAFGIVGSDASGTMEYDRSGGEVKRLHAGSAARAGIEAAELARLGLTGPRTIFEGPRGFFEMFAGVREPASVDSLTGHWHILDTMFRLVPGVATVLPALDLVAGLQDQHGFDWQEIERIDVGLPEFAVEHGGSIITPTDTISAHFSLAFALALRLVSGRSAPEQYVDPVMWSDPDISAVSRLVHAYGHDFDDGMPLLSGHVKITLRDGRVLSGTQAGFRGSTQRPASVSELHGKFRANVAGVLSEADTETVLDVIRSLDTVDDIGQLTHHLSPNPDVTRE